MAPARGRPIAAAASIASMIEVMSPRDFCKRQLTADLGVDRVEDEVGDPLTLTVVDRTCSLSIR